jgi:hypothetical protein
MTCSNLLKSYSGLIHDAEKSFLMAEDSKQERDLEQVSLAQQEEVAWDDLQDEIASDLQEKVAVSPFNKDQASHEVSRKRLQIALYVLAGLGFLLLISLALLYCLDIDLEDKREILDSVIASLFSALTLTIGFVAGSSIDNK